jgi:hypothetical protein
MATSKLVACVFRSRDMLSHAPHVQAGLERACRRGTDAGAIPRRQGAVVEDCALHQVPELLQNHGPCVRKPSMTPHVRGLDCADLTLRTYDRKSLTAGR